MISLKETDKLLKTAFALAVFTIAYNIVEGIVSAWFGFGDETLALFGFGIDSFVEVISGIGIAHMVMRMRKNSCGDADVNLKERDRFEKRALRITGTAFYILTAGLVIGSIITIVYGIKPQTTIPGIIISIISILTMYALFRAKLRVGTILGSAPIIADANCTKTCFYLSFILLASSIAFEIFQLPYVDAAGSLGIAWFAFSEGREAFEKAESGTAGCSCGHGCGSDK